MGGGGGVGHWRHCGSTMHDPAAEGPPRFSIHSAMSKHCGLQHGPGPHTGAFLIRPLSNPDLGFMAQLVTQEELWHCRVLCTTPQCSGPIPNHRVRKKGEGNSK